MQTTIPSADGRAVLEQFLEAAERKDYAAMATLAHPEIEMSWPQSGERFSGRDNALGALLATEEKPEIAGEPTILGEGSSWVLTMPLRYGADIYHYAGIFELEDGLVRRTIEFFGAPFPAQPARARFAAASGVDPMESERGAPEPRVLLIADLSGYTGYLIASEVEEAPAIAGDLVETMLGQLTDQFELAGLEGDAAFLHASLDALPGEQLLDAIGRCHRAFRQRIESLRQATTCECEACRRVPTLDLKFFVHVGPVVRQRILGRDELAGRDVIVVHRLLKDSQPARQGQRRFALLTDAAVRALAIAPDAHGLRPASQTYEHLGEIAAWAGDPEAWAERTIRDGASTGVMLGGATLREDRRIPAAPSVVWDLLTVPQLRERWEGIEQIAEDADGDLRGLGTMSRCVARRLATVEEIVDWRPPAAFARRVRGDSGEMTVTHQLAATDGQTDLRIEWHLADGRGLSRSAVRDVRGRIQRLVSLAAELSG